jgi:hypothetical protein
MNLKLDVGDLYIDPKGERFVFYYSVYDNVSWGTENRFDFDITGLDDDDNEFVFTLTELPELPTPPVEYYFNYTQLNTKETQSVSRTFTGLESSTITFNYPLTDAVRIDVNNDTGVDYGRIFIFDVGSLMYEISSSSSSNTYKATVENGGVLSTSNQISRYFFNEPKYFPQKLLDNSSMLTLRITQIKNTSGEGVDSIGATDDSIRVKFWLKPYNSSIEESKTPIFSKFSMMIYGDDAAVSAWRFFYKHRLNFEYDQIDHNKIYWDPQTDDDILFSFNHAVCNLKMEVEG